MAQDHEELDGTKHPPSALVPIERDVESGRVDKTESFQRTQYNTRAKGDNKCIEASLVFLTVLLVIITFPVSLLWIFVVVRHFERAIILRNGKIHKNRSFGPGLVCYLPCIDRVNFVDLRICCYAVPPQEALTKDSLTVSVDAVVYFKVIDPVSTVLNITDYRSSTKLLAATALRNSIGSAKLTEILIDRPAIGKQVLEQMKKLTSQWGIKVTRVDIKDISLPIQLQKAMAAEAESSRLANAKIIVAKAEIEATKNLQKASAILSDNPLSMQLRYLQSLHLIAGENAHTIVFPFSTETLRKIFK